MKKKLISIVLIVMLLVAAVTLTTACSKVSELLKDTSLTVQDGILKVANPVVNTVTKAFVNGEEQDIDDETYEITVPEDAGDKLDVAVEVYDEDGNKLGTIEDSFDCIPTVEVKAEEGLYDWTESDAAIKEAYPDETVGYFVWLNNKITKQAEATCVAPAGISTIRVRAYFAGDKTMYSRYSEMQSFTVLASPANPQYDGVYLTWGPVDFLDMRPSYAVKIMLPQEDGEDVLGDTVMVYKSSINLKSEFPEIFADAAKRARMNITVQAVSSDEKYQSSIPSATKLFSVLDQVENVHFEDGKVLWDENPNADSYKVRIEDPEGVTVYTVDTTEYELKVRAYNQINVQVQPNVKDEEGNDAVVFAPWSLGITTNYLPMVELQYESDIFYWSDVSGAYGYRFVIEKLDGEQNVTETIVKEDLLPTMNGGNEVPAATSYNVEKVFVASGDYKVTVTALAGVSTTYTNSVPSTPVIVTKLMAPRHFRLSESFTDKNIETQASPQTQMTIQFDQIGGNDIYYELYVDGSAVSAGSKGDSFTFVLPAATETSNEFTLDVFPRCSNHSIVESASDIEKVRRLTLSGTESLKIKVKKLLAPNQLKIDGDEYISWNDPNKDSDQYSVFKNGGSLGDTKVNNISLGGRGDGNYTIRVAARGPLYTIEHREYNIGDDGLIYENKPDATGLTYLVASSDLSNTYYLTKLATPGTESSIRLIENGTILTWPVVDGAVEYKISMNRFTSDGAPEVLYLQDGKGNYGFKTNTISLAGLTFENDGSPVSLTEYGCTFSIVAVGNHGNVVDGERITMDSDSTASIVLVKLDKPLGLSIDDDHMSWNPDDTGNVAYYEVYDGDTLIGQVTSGSSFTLANTIEGDHHFNVRAIGDGVKYFPSDPAILDNSIDIGSAYKRIVKLPSLLSSWTTLNDEYVWEEVEYETSYRTATGLEKKIVTPKSYIVSLNVSGETVHQVTFTVEDKGADGKYHYKPNFDGFASPVITVICKGDNFETYDSDSFAFYQPTRSLGVPTAIGSEPLISFVMVDGKVNIAVNAVSQGEGFILRYSGSDHVLGIGETYVIPDDTIGEYNVTVRNRGEYFDRNGVYVLSSGESNSYSVKLLNKVSSIRNLHLEKATNSVTVSWNTVTDATYRAYYALETATGEYIASGTRIDTGSGNTVKFDAVEMYNYIEQYRNDTDYQGYINLKVYVMTVGNDSTVFSSTVYTSNTFVNIENSIKFEEVIKK